MGVDPSWAWVQGSRPSGMKHVALCHVQWYFLPPSLQVETQQALLWSSLAAHEHPDTLGEDRSDLCRWGRAGGPGEGRGFPGSALSHLLGAAVETSLLHGVDGVAQELVRVLLAAEAEVPGDLCGAWRGPVSHVPREGDPHAPGRAQAPYF